MTIAVEGIEFDTQACVLRVRGRNVEENSYVKVKFVLELPHISFFFGFVFNVTFREFSAHPRSRLFGRLARACREIGNFKFVRLY